MHDIVPCLSPWRYRNKMEFSFSQNRAGEHFLGLMLARGRGRVLNLTECHLAPNWFSEALHRTREWWKASPLKAYHPHSNTGSLRTLTLREGLRTQDKMAILTVSGDPAFALTRKEISSFVAALQDVCQEMSIFLRIHQQIKGVPTQFFEMHLAGPDHLREQLKVEVDGKLEVLSFKISPSVFFQPNPLQAELLYGYALKMGCVAPHSHVFDLYCGTAALSMVFAKKAHRVTAIELSPESILDAESNLELNHIKNVELHCGDVGKILCGLNHPTPDLVVVDPPRAGLDAKALQHVIQLQSKEILYVSCNPTTAVQNIIPMLDHGYQLQEVQPVDQFPHTPHLEIMIKMRKT